MKPFAVMRQMTSDAARVATILASVSGSAKLWYALRETATLQQDSAGTTPVTSAGQPIGRIMDKSGAGNHATQATSTSRATWQTSYAALDGVDDSWVTPSMDFTGTNKITVIAGVRKASDAATGLLIELSAAADSNTGGFNLAGPVGASGANYQLQTGLVGARVYTRYGSFAAPVTNVLTASYDNTATGAAQVALRANGVVRTGTTTVNGGASGNFGNYPLYIGRQNNATLPFNGSLFGLIIVGRALSADETLACERYMTQQVGISL